METIPLTRKQVVVLAVVVEAGLAVLALLGAWVFGVPIGEWVLWSVTGLLWGLAGAAGLLAILGLCHRFPVGPVGRLMRLVDTVVAPLFRECRAADLLLISILAGLGEELFFRGLLQFWIEPHFGGWFGEAAGPWIAVALVSVLFGLAHCISREYTVFATLLGFLLGALAILTGDLLAPIVAHAGYDFVALLMLTRTRTNAPTRS